jgi:hypothetical protein
LYTKVARQCAKDFSEGILNSPLLSAHLRECYTQTEATLNVNPLQPSEETAMLYSLWKSFRLSERGNFWTCALRLAASLVLALILPLAASAYTVVLRDGRRIEIPAKFVVTPATLTYEVAAGINITLQMSAIDIEATERANQEPGGSLLRRAEEPSEIGPAIPSASTPRPAATTSPRAGSTPPTPQRSLRTVTNRDLEAARRARLASEAAYERRRRELGLPSLAEARRRASEEAARARTELRQSMSEEAQAEGYWRAQASELRSQLAALNAQIDYVRGLLAGLPDRPAVGSYTVLASVGVLFPGRGATGFPPNVIGRPGLIGQPGINGNPAFIARAPHIGHQSVFVAPNIGPQLTARVGFGGGSTRGQVLLNTTPLRRGFGHPTVFPRGLYASPATLLGSTYTDESVYEYDRATLVQRLRELELERAGLQARWRILEDEARRAGALPGWLRP